VDVQVTAFAELLSSQGCLPAAMQYLLALHTSDAGGELALLTERIYGHDATLLAGPPPTPYVVTQVDVSPDVHYERVAAQPPSQPDSGSYPLSDVFGNAPSVTQVQDKSRPAFSGQPVYTASQPTQASYGAVSNGHYAPQPAAHAVAYAQQPSYALPAPALPYSYPPPAPAQATIAQPPAAVAAATAYAVVHPPAATPVPAPSYTYSAPPAPATAAPAYAYTPPTQPLPFTGGHLQPVAAEQQAAAAAAPAPPPQPSYDPEPVVSMLSRLLDKCSAFNLPPLEQRKVDDIKKRLGLLADKLRSGAVTAAVFEKLLQLCTALGSGDARTAQDLHVQITTSDWSDNGPWLMGVKRLLEMTSKLGVTL